MFYPNSDLGFKDSLDGASSTLLIAEVKAWTHYTRNGGPPNTRLPDNAAEVDPDSPDDFIVSGQMSVVNGFGSVKWETVWSSDFFGFGGDPEYKFVVLNTSSPELVVR